MPKKDAIDLTTLMGKSSRTYQSRKVTDEMVRSRTHVAIALWDIPWKSAPHGKLHGWVIAVDAGPRRRFVRTGKTMKADPNPLVFKEFQRIVTTVPKPVWVVVGRRQAALGTLIRNAGYQVTGSFADENKAGDRARALRKSHEAQAVKRSKREGEQPAKRAVEVEIPPTHWLPNRSRFDHTGTHVRIATDASSDTLSKGSMCFVASNGDFQLRTRMTKAGTDELELETITLALKYAFKQGFSDVVIESDSVAALEAVDHILAGGRFGKTWRGVSSGARSRFKQAWVDMNRQGKVKIGRVLGHAGDPLNHAADRIAYLGLRASNYPQRESGSTAWAEVDNILTKLEGKLAR
ncbi:RNase H family protein [uncultured Corynebacterium sp.]|uniref:RNase H family protein n=1 Tax=uncultured Corynebacterium sp. TaxID=159447 RepID=UPI0025FD8EE6|nr:RNase H family protein [uncultured Corynebacterium sp.]